MKKLLKLLVLGGIVAVVVTILRDQLLPGPTPPTSHPPPFRNVPPEPQPHEAGPAKTPGGDDLTVVKGIGPVYAKRLGAAGIESFADLASADAADLAARTDLPVERVADWIGKAADLG